jgi:hypothetical protein
MKTKFKITVLSAVLLMLAGGFSSCQKDPTFLTVDEAPVAVASEGGEFTIEVKSNGNWSATIENAEDADWCVLENYTGANDGVITVNIAKNELLLVRNAVVVITLNGLTKRVEFSQEAREPYEREGTKWEFIGIMHTETDSLEKIEPNPSLCSIDCYTIMFITDIRFIVISAETDYLLRGPFDLDMLGQWAFEAIGLPPGDSRFRRVLWDKNTNSYTFISDELRIINNTQNYYLLFKRIDL